RGRSGRQGDPGESRFYVSLEDDLMRLFGAGTIEGLLDRLGMDDSMPIEHRLVSKAIEKAQKKVEGRNFEIRKNVLEYDDVINQQRELVYGERRKILFGSDLKTTVTAMVEDVVVETVSRFAGEQKWSDEWELDVLLEYLDANVIPDHNITPEEIKGQTKHQVTELFSDLTQKRYEQREHDLSPEIMRSLERAVLLNITDDKWMEHIDAMDQLRHGISLRAYGQRDPLVEYKYEAYEAFQDMMASMREDVVRNIYRMRLVVETKERQMYENREETGPKNPVKVAEKPGRNDLCPCGSGKKYKKCCGIND
ncbi:MAG: SEC-C metal-binding domain-containing protein, partial [Methylocystaceae bacterium]